RSLGLHRAGAGVVQRVVPCFSRRTGRRLWPGTIPERVPGHVLVVAPGGAMGVLRPRYAPRQSHVGQSLLGGGDDLKHCLCARGWAGRWSCFALVKNVGPVL